MIAYSQQTNTNRLINLLMEHEELTVEQIYKAIPLGQRQIWRLISCFIRIGLIQTRGTGRQRVCKLIVQPEDIVRIEWEVKLKDVLGLGILTKLGKGSHKVSFVKKAQPD